MMPRAYCDREDCCYHSLGGWCQLGHPRWSAESTVSEVNCQLIHAFRQDQASSNRTPS